MRPSFQAKQHLIPFSKGHSRTNGLVVPGRLRPRVSPHQVLARGNDVDAGARFLLSCQALAFHWTTAGRQIPAQAILEIAEKRFYRQVLPVDWVCQRTSVVIRPAQVNAGRLITCESVALFLHLSQLTCHQ
jgi:hypothetical protein